MMTLDDDYIGKGNGHSNGHANGNGHTNGNGKKVFSLVPAQDEMTAVILRTRREALCDPDLLLGAKVLFCILLDWSLWPGKNKGPGVITISTTKLKELLTCSKRAIWQWKKQLVEKRLVWITNHYLPNAYPMHTYHITALHPQEHGGEMPTHDGLWGNGHRRQQEEWQGTGARGNTQRTIKVGGKSVLRSTKRHLTTDTKTRVYSENATGNGKNGHPSVANSAIGSRTTCDGESQNLRLAAAKSATGNRTKGNPATAENGTSQPHKQAPLGEAQSKRKEHSEVMGKASPPVADQGEAIKPCLAQQFAKWHDECVAGPLTPSRLIHLERTRERLVQQRKASSDATIRDFIQRKIRAIDEKLDGPLPEPEPKKPVTGPGKKLSDCPDVGPMPGTPEYEQFKREIRR